MLMEVQPSPASSPQLSCCLLSFVYFPKLYIIHYAIECVPDNAVLVNLTLCVVVGEYQGAVSLLPRFSICVKLRRLGLHIILL